MSKKVFIKTYGCQMNVYDSERMTDSLMAEGYEVSETPDDADLVLLNTCHIREKAAEKLYSDVGRLRMIKNARDKDMTIAVTGCVAQAEGSEMLRRADAVDMVVGPQAYHRLPDMLKKTEAAKAKGKRLRLTDTDFPLESKFDHLKAPRRNIMANAFLTVQEGCDKFCTFCVVPYTRGGEVSRPLSALIDEARDMATKGVREITLLGQNVNAYHGTDDAGVEVGLADLIRRIAGIEGIERVRYTTSHPRDMTDDLLAAHRDLETCMPYLHLPVQSGSNAVLDAMNRKHTREDYFAIIDKLREARPDIALSGDFIVGFPGESDQDFEDTLDLVRRVGYASAYSFKYSPRPGTPAAEMDEQVDETVKTDRLQRLQALINEQQVAFNERSVGQVMDVLLERRGKEDGQLIGRSPYLQSVHVDVTKSDYMLDGDAENPYSGFMGKMVPVRIVSAGPNSLKGEVVGAPR